MAKHFSQCLVVFLVGVFCVAWSPVFAGGNQVNPKSVGMSADRLAHIDNVIQAEIDAGRLPHATALVARDGKIVYEKYLGQASPTNNQDLESDAIFRIASLSKVVTSVAAMMCYEEGKFLMDDPISKYIPAFANQVVGENDGNGGLNLVPVENEATIRNALTHKAGLIYGDFIEAGHPLKTEMANEQTHLIFPWTLDESLESYINRVGSQPLYRQPGGEITYGVSTDVLGRLVEIWSGQSLDDFMQERIFEPLGMDDTHFFLPTNKISRLPDLYFDEGDGTISLWITPDADPQVVGNGPNKVFSGAAGLLSTPQDYLKFCEMLRNGGKHKNKWIMSPQSINMMTADHVAGTPNLPFFLALYGDGTGFGVGTRFARGNDDGLESAGTVSFAGITKTRFWIDSQEDVVIISLTQVYTLELAGYTHKVKNVGFGAINKSKKDYPFGKTGYR